MCDASVEVHSNLAVAKHDNDAHGLAQETLLRLWLKLGVHDAVMMPAQFLEASNAESCPPLEVRWMATGDLVCSIPSDPSARISVVEAAVREKTGVPEREQRLYQDGKELAVEDSVSSIHVCAPILLVRTISDPRITNLSHFHIPLKFEEVRASDFKMVRKVSQGINGDIFRYRWLQEDSPDPFSGQCISVAVKKLRNTCLRYSSQVVTDERAAHLEPWKHAPPAEDALAEIGVLTYLSKQTDLPKFLIRMLGCFAGPSNQTWLVSEFAEGGELFDLAAAQSLSQDKVARYSCELLQAVHYLHGHHISHRDISLENVLIKDDAVKLMDFGQAVRSHSGSGAELRYFRAVGKTFYRAPECYVPLTAEIRVTAPAFSQPEDIVMVTSPCGYLCEVRLPLNSAPGTSCKCEVWGYAGHPVDIFATGMCIFILCCGFPIWQKALLVDPSFAYVHSLGEGGIASILGRWQRPLPAPAALDLMTDMMQTHAPSKRPSASDCLASSWFTLPLETQHA